MNVKIKRQKDKCNEIKSSFIILSAAWIFVLYLVLCSADVDIKNTSRNPEELASWNCFRMFERESPSELTEEPSESFKAENEELHSEVVKSFYETSEAEIEEQQLESLGEFKIIAYCSCKKCCGKWAENRPVDEDGNEIVYTASGRIAEAGKTIAVDTDVIPFGTVVYINGNEYIAADTGSAVKGNVIDIYFDDHEEALNWGCQYAEVIVRR